MLGDKNDYILGLQNQLEQVWSIYTIFRQKLSEVGLTCHYVYHSIYIFYMIGHSVDIFNFFPLNLFGGWYNMPERSN